MRARRLAAGSTYVLIVAATCVAAAPWLRAFPQAEIVSLTIGAAVLSVGLPVLIALGLRRSVAWSAAGSVVLFLVFTLLAVLRSPLDGSGVIHGLGNGIARLLSTHLPVSQPRWIVVPAIALTWLTGALASELLTRTRSTGPVVLAPILSFLAAFSVVPSSGGVIMVAGSLLGLVAGGLLFARRWALDQAAHDEGSAQPAEPTERALVLRPLLLGILSLLAVLGLCAAFLPRLPRLAGLPTSLERRPSVRTVAPIAPTVAVAKLRAATSAQDPKPLFTVQANRSFDGYIALSELDQYDGDIWTVRRTFQPTGGDIPGVPSGRSFPASGLRAEDITQRYTMSGLSGDPWMPYVERPVKVTGVSAEFDAGSGMIIPSQGLAEGDAYSVLSTVVTRTLSQLSSSQLQQAQIGTSPLLADSQANVTDHDALDNAVTQLATDVGQSKAPTLSFLGAVLSYMHTHFRRITLAQERHGTGGAAASPLVQHPDLYGTSFADVTDAVLGSSHEATPEQFATMFALVARDLDVPARVVTGFRLGGPGGLAQARAGRTYTVTNVDAWTWVEIPVSGVGWVVADPTPTATGVAPATKQSESTTPTTLPPRQANALPTPSDSGHALAPPVHHGGSQGGRLPLLVIAIPVGLAGAIAVVALGIVGWKARRRRRRRGRPDPRLKIEGAWLETLDTLDEAQLRGIEPLTGAELVTAVGARFGNGASPPTLDLGMLADRALFSSRIVSDGEAASAWTRHDEIRRAIRSHQSGPEWVRSSLRVARRRRMESAVPRRAPH